MGLAGPSTDPRRGSPIVDSDFLHSLAHDPFLLVAASGGLSPSHLSCTHPAAQGDVPVPTSADWKSPSQKHLDQPLAGN